jgi:Zn-dependent peptidase ImmA (M78 family)
MSPSVTPAYIEPKVLRWARESAGYSLREAADAIGIEKWYLERAETGGDLLSLDEAEKAASVYRRSLASLFVPEPPPEEPQAMQFRRLPGTPLPPWGPAVQLTARAVSQRQRAALEVYEALDESAPWLSVSERLLHAQERDLPDAVRDLLEVPRETQRAWTGDEYAPFRGWREAVERLGVLVMQSGPVGVVEMRGFASVEPPELPAILVNNKDHPYARAFTILHELGHIVLSRRGAKVGPETERWCESFAGQVLMPTAWLREAVETTAASTALGLAQEVAKTFHVTPLAAVTRLTRAGLVPRDEGWAAASHIRSRWNPPDEATEEEGAYGGNYYLNQIGYFGPGYLRLVFSAIDNQAVTLPAATDLLDGVKVKNFEKLRDRLERR